MTPWKANTECPHPKYTEFKQMLNLASMHFADDSGKEWNTAKEYIKNAAKIAIDCDWPVWAINRMFNEIEHLLVDKDTFYQVMFNLLKTQVLNKP